MEFKFDKKQEISYYAADNRLRLTVSALMAFFQDIAIEHSDSAGYTVKRLSDQNRGWVITNYHIVIDRMPECGESIVFRTWSSGIKHFQAERSYTATDSHGKEIIKAASRWIFMDLEKRAPVAIPPEMDEAYNTGARPAVEGEKYRMPKEKGEIISSFELEVTRSQTDTNGHTNNTQYAAWASDMVPEDIYNEYEICDFKIVFRKESRRGDRLVLNTYKSQRDGIIEIFTEFLNKESGVVCSEAVSLWRR
ncbi:thioesterase [Lachnospiraceae bacterium NSJ-143]|nr:thioesterase [Lachnospiraceae bacterium NSJ-143]